jgi:hypothetical protein
MMTLVQDMELSVHAGGGMVQCICANARDDPNGQPVGGALALFTKYLWKFPDTLSLATEQPGKYEVALKKRTVVVGANMALFLKMSKCLVHMNGIFLYDW